MTTDRFGDRSVATDKFGSPTPGRLGVNHHYPEGSDHEHYVFTFDNGYGADVASDRDDPDFWWLQPLVDGAPDPRHDGVRGLDDQDVADHLGRIARWERVVSGDV